jgi:hypothetical protein
MCSRTAGCSAPLVLGSWAARAPDHGMTSSVIATGLMAGDWVSFTVEPVDGSRGSASAPILMLNLTGLSPEAPGPGHAVPARETTDRTCF